MNLRLILGVTLAILAVYCLATIAVIREIPLYALLHRPVGIGGSVIGLLLVAFGFWQLRRAPVPPGPAREAGETEEADETEGSPPGWDLRYTGCLAVLLGLATFFILPHDPPPTVVRAVAPPATKPPPAALPSTNPPPADPPAPPPPVTFSSLRLQGIFYDPNRPSALINKRTYFVGDEVDGARIVAITTESVTVELNGARKLLRLDR